MPSKEKHLEQYRKNINLANSDLLKEEKYRDWRVTTIFYAGMHLLDSSYANMWHPPTHEKRKNFLYDTIKYRDIIDDYENLEMLSRKARYKCVNILEREVESALENLQCIENMLIE